MRTARIATLLRPSAAAIAPRAAHAAVCPTSGNAASSVAPSVAAVAVPHAAFRFAASPPGGAASKPPLQAKEAPRSAATTPAGSGKVAKKDDGKPAPPGGDSPSPVSQRNEARNWDGAYSWFTLMHELMPMLSLTAGIAGSIGRVLFFGLPTPDQALSAVATFTVVQRFLSRAARCPKGQDLTNKVCIVTGASSGIGCVVSAELLKRGATVICTNHSKTEEETRKAVLSQLGRSDRDKFDESDKLIVWPLALEDRASILKFCNIAKKQFPDGIDVLLNNAGNMVGHDVEVSANNLELTVDVSYVGPVLLTETLLPLVHKREGRVVFVGSHLHRIVTTDGEIIPERIIKATLAAKYTGDDDPNYTRFRQWAYAKFGQTCHMVSIVKRGGKAVIVNPGRVATRLRRVLFPGINTTQYLPAVLWVMRTPREGAQSVLHACVEDDAKLEWGGYYFDCRLRKYGLSKFVLPVADTAVAWAARQAKVSLWYAPGRAPKK